MPKRLVRESARVAAASFAAAAKREAGESALSEHEDESSDDSSGSEYVGETREGKESGDGASSADDSDDGDSNTQRIPGTAALAGDDGGVEGLVAIDDDEIADVRAAAVDMFGEEVLRTGGPGSGAPGSASSVAAASRAADAAESARSIEAEWCRMLASSRAGSKRPRPNEVVPPAPSQPLKAIDAVIFAATASMRAVRARVAAASGPSLAAALRRSEKVDESSASYFATARAPVAYTRRTQFASWLPQPGSTAAATAASWWEPASVDEDGGGATDMSAAKAAEAQVSTTSPSLQQELLAAAAVARATLSGQRATVSQTVKFAGQMVTVQKVVVGGAPAPAPAPAASGIGAALSSLDAPATVNTLAKSGYDWDSYKAQHGLEEELAAAAKEGVGHLGKQAFLARVGERADEMHLEATRRAAASAALAAAASGARSLH